MMYPIIDQKKTGANIKRLRKEKKIPINELQKYFGFRNPQTIYKWQRGECLPTVDNLYALSKCLGVSMEEIIIEKD